MTPTTTIIALKELTGNHPPVLDALQKFLLPHVDALIMGWRIIWVLTLVTVCLLYIRAWRHPDL